MRKKAGRAHWRIAGSAVDDEHECQIHGGDEGDKGWDWALPRKVVRIRKSTKEGRTGNKASEGRFNALVVEEESMDTIDTR